MKTTWPDDAAQLVEGTHWYVEDGKLWTRKTTTGHRVEGVWIECDHCHEIRPAWKYNAMRFCSLQCRNAAMRQDWHPHWKGGRQKEQNGYYRVSVGDGRRLLEHRYVMEQMIGRPLTRSETVHHKNGDRGDNRPENLELWVGRHPPGASEKHCPTCTCFDH